LESFEGLGMIPIDILQQGSKKIARYVLDLYRSPEGIPLYRSKLMVVGFESVGKTTVLDCLFPLEGWLFSQGKLVKTKYWFKLQGNTLRKYASPEDQTPHKAKITIFENRQWELTTPPKPFCIKIAMKQKVDGQKDLELYCPDEESYRVWLPRLRRVCMNEATHGIDIQTVKVDNKVTRDYFRRRETEEERKGTLELSVWDFAGQNEYYNNHHYFLSTRSVFLALWKMSEGEEKGLKGLAFWFRSLATHLGKRNNSAVTTSSGRSKVEGGLFASVIVVGTFLDHPSVKKTEKNTRANLVHKLAQECGLIGSATSPISSVQYYEVSCSGTLENVDLLQDALFKTVVDHSYMGERVPQSYLQIGQFVRRLRVEKAALPVVSVAELDKDVNNVGLVWRALGLLSLWGECVYFDSPPDLASLVILDPRFLTQGILADLFTSDTTIVGMKKGGVIRHSDLAHIWARFRPKGVGAEEFATACQSFMAILEKMGVCFAASSTTGGKEDFMNRHSIIPALLPERHQDPSGEPRFREAWPIDPPFSTPVQIERVIKFVVVPSELVSRMLVHLHAHIQNGLVWKDQVLLLVKELDQSQAWIRVEVPHNRFIVVIRGRELAECTRLLDYLVKEVKEVAVGSSPVGQEGEAVLWQENVRSPHSAGAVEINLQDAMKDLGLQEHQRSLVCPDTRLPVKAELLLAAAGIPTSPSPVATSPSWWDFSSAIEDEGHETLLSSVFEGQEVKNQELFDKFKRLFAFFKAGEGSDPTAPWVTDGVERVYAINNPRLRSAFEIKREVIGKQHQTNPGLFRREGWRSLEDSVRRKRTFLRLSAKIQDFRTEFNDGSLPFIVPMIHGTNENSASRVIENGFGTVATTDDGYFGRGMYFTSDLRYANLYAKQVDKTGELKVMVLAIVIPGNPYPVTEHPFVVPTVWERDQDGRTRRKNNPQGLLGQACKAGYQSHFVIVDSESAEVAYPTTREDLGDRGVPVSDELIIFEGAQALPVFLVYYRPSDLMTNVNSSVVGSMPSNVPVSAEFAPPALVKAPSSATALAATLSSTKSTESLDQFPLQMLLTRSVTTTPKLPSRLPSAADEASIPSLEEILRSLPGQFYSMREREEARVVELETLKRQVSSLRSAHEASLLRIDELERQLGQKK